MCKELKPATLSGLLGGEARRRVGLSSFTLSHFVVTSLVVLFLAGCGTKTTDTTSAPTAPSAPTGLSAAAGNGQVMISWSSVSGATSYNLYWSTTTGVTKTNGTKITGATSPYTHTTLTNGTTYYYIVTAVNSVGESVESAQASGTPTAPTGTVDMSGTWTTSMSGTIFSGESGAGQTTWLTITITQSGSNVSGTSSYSDTLGRSGTFTISAATISGNIMTVYSTDPDAACASRTITSTLTVTSTTPGSQMTETFTAPASGTCQALSGSITYTKQAGTTSLIANTSRHETSIGAAFDGTNFLVGIGDKLQSDTTNANQSVTAQFVSKTGTLVGPRISTGATGGLPEVAFDGTNYLLVYEAASDTLAGQFVNTSGALVGTQFNIATATGRKMAVPRGVIFDGTNYFVVWQSNSDVFGQFITTSGAKLGSVVSISTAAYGQRDIALAFDGANILAIWVDGRNQSACYTDGTGMHCYESDIYGQFITKSSASAAGALSGGNFLIDAGTLPRDNPTGIAYDGTNYLVTFVEEAALPNACPVAGCNWEAYGILVSKTGATVGSKFVIGNTTTSHKMFPLPTYIGTQYLVTWTDGMGTTSAKVKGQYVTTSGAVSGSEFTLFSPVSSGAVPWLGMVFTGGGVNLAVTSWGIPDAPNSGNVDLYTSADVMGSIITAP